MAIRQIAIERAKFRFLEIQDLNVTRLHVAEVTVSDSIKLPDGNNRDGGGGESPPRQRAGRRCYTGATFGRG